MSEDNRGLYDDGRKMGILSQVALGSNSRDRTVVALSFSIFKPLEGISTTSGVYGVNAMKVLEDAKIYDFTDVERLNNWPCFYKGDYEFIELIIAP